MTWIDAIGYLAAILMFSTFYMKKMIPLRAVGASANVTFVIYAAFTHVYPLLILHAMLFPLNISRMLQMMKLVKKVENAAKGDFALDFLVPFMKKELHKKGDVIFSRGDESNKIYYLQKGLVKIKEVGIFVTEGELLGEMGVFSPNKKRTATVVCETDCEFYTIVESNVLQLYYQNPKFGFFLTQLIIKRFSKNMEAVRQVDNILKPGSLERRQTDRMGLKFEAVINGTNSNGEVFAETAIVENISEDGALVTLKHKVADDSNLYMLIDPAGTNVKVSSRVIWQTPNGDGMRTGVVFRKKEDGAISPFKAALEGAVPAQ